MAKESLFDIEFDQAQLRRLMATLNGHPWNRKPGDVLLEVCKKVAPTLADEIAENAPVRTGRLYLSIEPIARYDRKLADTIQLGVKIEWYWLFLPAFRPVLAALFSHESLIDLIEGEI